MKKKLKELRDKIIRLEQENIKINLTEQNLIISTLMGIKEKHEKLREPINKEIDLAKIKLKDHTKKLQSFSTFDNRIIGNILEKLVSVFEGEEYCYQETFFKTKKPEFYLFDKDEPEINKKVRIIINSDCQKNNYDHKFNNLNFLVDNDKAIILEEDDDSLEPQISFNHYFENNNIDNEIKSDKFNYVKEFIEKVINFKIDNNLKNIKEKELNILLKEFLMKNADLIETNYQQRLKELEIKYKEIYQEHQNRYIKQLNRINAPLPKTKEKEI